MKIETHIAVGLFLGMLFYYFFDFGFEFVFLTGFAAFLPDIDWSMQFRWGMGNRHRTFAHNIWFVLFVSTILGVVFMNMYIFLGAMVGMLSHLIADSYTVTGVSWLYPYGFEKKFYLKGPYSMSDKTKVHFERRIQAFLFGASGLLLLFESVSVNIFSVEGIITIAVITFAGYMIFKNFDKGIKRAIRRIGV